jgi:integrase
MARSEVSADGTEFTVPAARHKSKRDFLVPLSEAAQAVLARVPVSGSKGLVFTTYGEAPISGFSKTKRAFDKAVLKELRQSDQHAKAPERWTNHDRRTARSLMSRAGVPPNHAERALGHVIGGVQGTYDRCQYAAEKRQAFEA